MWSSTSSTQQHNSTSDQEDHLVALLQTAAAKMGGNITVRQSPAYTSQAEGNVERFHRTLMGQVRTLKAQLQNNYDITISSKHPIVPWLVRHTAFLVNRYLTHPDGNTSYFRRWNKDHRQPLCEFGETVQYLLPTSKQLPKMEQRFMPGIWLGREVSTGENTDRHPKQSGQSKNNSKTSTAWEVQQAALWCAQPNRPSTAKTIRTSNSVPSNDLQSTKKADSYDRNTNTWDHSTTTAATGNSGHTNTESTSISTSTGEFANGNAPTSCHSRQALPSPTKRGVLDEVAEGSLPKQQRTTSTASGPARPETTEEPPKTKIRITKVTITTKQGTEITAYSSEDVTEQQTEKILLEPMVKNTEGLDKQKTIDGMKHEIQSMKSQQVCLEVNIGSLTLEQRKNIIQSRWVLREKGNTVRARIVAKGFTETVADLDEIYASTPIFCVLRTLLALSCNNNWIVKTGDISVAFLHAAAAAAADLYMYPPREFYNPADKIIWKLNKAIYGLRSNIYMTANRNCFVLVYVDDIMFLGEETVVNKIFETIQQQLLLRPTGTLTPGNTVSFLGRNITNRGDHYEISLNEEYATDLLAEMNLSNSKPAAAVAPGTSALKTATAEQDQQLSADEHAQYRRAVGKLQWMTYTRPDISYATKELARALQQPTTSDQQKLKHLLRYINGTKHYKQVIRPTGQATSKSNTRPQRLRGFGLGRMSNDKKVNNRICHHNPGNSHQLRKQNTSNNSTLKCRSRALCNQHRSNRSLAHQKPSDGTS